MSVKSKIKFWNKHKFKIMVIGSILILIILSFFNDKEGGSYSLEYSYVPEAVKKKAHFKRESEGERECRRVMEAIFMRPFPTRRPDFLRNHVTNKNLEIDCCNMELGLGVEYNGKQHYTYTKGMHKNYESFRNQQYRDEMKMKMCKENDFELIVVPYTVPKQSIENYLKEELKQRGILA